MTTILYNGIDPFSGLAPTPLVARSITMISYGERWGQLHSLSLRGHITGRCPTYQETVNKQKELISGFGKDFQTLQIYDYNYALVSGSVVFDSTFETFDSVQIYFDNDVGLSGALVTEYSNVKVADISFDANNYADGYLPFEIKLDVYPSQYFSGQYGILEPKEEVQFTEEEDGQVKVSHTTSAKGFCTTSTNPNNALENARAWVQSRTGWSSQILPAFIQGFNGSNMCLQELSENSDRLNGNYQVNETYISDIYDSGVGLLRYTTDYSSGIEEGISEMRLRGNINGCKYQDLSGLRARYASFDAFNECNNQFYKIAGRADLNSIPVSKSVGEDQTHKIITFDYAFNDDMRPKISVSYELGYDYNFESDIVSVSVSARVFAKGAYTTGKWNDVKDVASRIDLFPPANAGYRAYVAVAAPYLASYPLINNPRSYSRTENEFTTSIEVSATYDNRNAPPGGFDKYDYTLSFQPAIHQYSPNPILDAKGDYYIFDLGYARRGSLSIKADAQASLSITPAQAEAIAKSETMKLQTQYLIGTKKLLDSQEVTKSNAAFDREFSVSASYSANQTEFTV